MNHYGTQNEPHPAGNRPGTGERPLAQPPEAAVLKPLSGLKPLAPKSRIPEETAIGQRTIPPNIAPPTPNLLPTQTPAEQPPLSSAEPFPARRIWTQTLSQQMPQAQQTLKENPTAMPLSGDSAGESYDVPSGDGAQVRRRRVTAYAGRSVAGLADDSTQPASDRFTEATRLETQPLPASFPQPEHRAHYRAPFLPEAEVPPRSGLSPAPALTRLRKTEEARRNSPPQAVRTTPQAARPAPAPQPARPSPGPATLYPTPQSNGFGDPRILSGTAAAAPDPSEEDSARFEAIHHPPLAEPMPVPTFATVQPLHKRAASRPKRRKPPARKARRAWLAVLLCLVLLGSALAVLYATGMLSPWMASLFPATGSQGVPTVFAQAPASAGGEGSVTPAAQASTAVLRSASVESPQATAPAELTFTLDTNTATTSVRLLTAQNDTVHTTAYAAPKGDGLTWQVTATFEVPYTGEIRFFLRDASGLWTTGSLTCEVDVR